MPRPELPYLFAYDIRCPVRGRVVLRCLRRWRVDGQLSAHETWLRPHEVYDLATELLTLVDQDVDSVLLCRLSQRGTGPIYRLHRAAADAPVVGPRRINPLPKYLHDGWYVIAYDIADPRRLRRVHQIAKKRAAFLQRSVYAFNGRGTALLGLLTDIRAEIKVAEDDVRIYSISGPSELWFLAGGVPLAGIAGPRGASLWQRLRQWLRTRFG